MARRKTGLEEETLPQPSFEQALTGLESIVDAMEHEHLSLEDLVAHYEKGAAYLNRCEAILQSARGRIELITLRNQNEIGLAADEKRDQAADSADPSALTGLPDDLDDDDDDIRLF